MRFLTWDTAILASLGVLLAYSLLIRKHRSLATLLSVYVGYIVAATWGSRIYDLFNGTRTIPGGVWIQANTTPAVVQSVLLVVVTLLLSSFVKLGGRRSKYSMPEVAVYSVATLALAVVFIVSFLDPAVRDHVLATSKIVPPLYTWRQLVLGLPVLLMVLAGIYLNED